MSLLNQTELIDMLIRHEGVKLKPYQDTVGKWTIGVGRNLDDLGITESEARYLLENDLGRIRLELDDALPWWRTLDGPRQTVLLNMAFNLGITRLLGFMKFLRSLREGNYQRAAGEMLDSAWAKQVHRRAVELAGLMQSPVET